jgi:hypothetical protein
MPICYLLVSDALDPRARQTASLGKGTRRHSQWQEELFAENFPECLGFSFFGSGTV